MRFLLFLLSLGVIFVIKPAFADTPAHDARIVVPVHDIARGEVISDSDLVYATVPADRMPPLTATAMSDLDGKETRRVLRAGQSVRLDDVRQPILVKKGSTVTVTFEAPGITLTATGKAMNEGGMGENVVVLNPASYRQISATVIGPGAVRAGDTTATIAPKRVASNP